VTPSKEKMPAKKTKTKTFATFYSLSRARASKVASKKEETGGKRGSFLPSFLPRDV
jgi:hypothetical protein